MEGIFVLGMNRNQWRIRVVVVGALALLLPMVVLVLMSANVQAHVSTMAVQPIPTVDVTATVTALNTEKLVHENDWWWNYGATILTSIISTLTLAAAGIFAVMRYFNDRNAERERRKEEQERWLKDQEAEREKRAEEHFQVAIERLGSEREEARVGAAVMLRTFLHPGYEQFYTQIFDLAVANLCRREVSTGVHHQLRDTSRGVDAVLPLTRLNQALIVVFREAVPLVRGQKRKGSESLNATGVQLDQAQLGSADLRGLQGSYASLRRANLMGADLSGAVLMAADLSGAALVGADLSDAILVGASLMGAILLDVKVNRAVLLDVDLREAKGLTKEQWAECKAKGALVDEESAFKYLTQSDSTSPPLKPESEQLPSLQETPPTPDASQSNGTSSQAAPDQGTSGEAKKGDDVGRTP